MSALRILVALSLGSAASAALKPLESDFQPAAGKAAPIYKTTLEGDLRMNLFFPPGWRAADRRPAIVLFFGGGCANGSAAQFASAAEYFAGRGMVAASAEYRIESVHHAAPRDCIEDGKSAIRWLRIHAARLGIDPHRIAAGGGSSGASIAAFAAYHPAIEAGDEDRSVSPAPDALVLINPAFGFGDRSRLTPEEQRVADSPLGALLASWKVHAGGPPAILFFGTEDSLQEKARDFARQLVRAGVRAEFHTAEGQRHGFFNRDPNSPWRAAVLRAADRFLRSLGFLAGDPTIPPPPVVLQAEPL